MKILNAWGDVLALPPGWEIFVDGPGEWRCYPPGEIQRPVAAPDTRSEIAKEIESSPALSALTEELAKLKGVTKDALVVSLDTATKVAK